MSKMWEKALKSYSYPVTLSEYGHAQNYSGHFAFSPINDRASTILFEDYFRNNASTKLGYWLEVVFWKMYSQGGRRDIKTNDMASHFKTSGITASQLSSTCNNYIKNDTRQNLQAIVKCLGFTSTAIAISATFPSFLRPDLYPMVDTRIAKWVGKHMTAYNTASPNSPQLIRPRYLDTKSTVLTLSDIDFVKSWTLWCRHKATQLSNLTTLEWRPRDVEMAVFYAWGDRNTIHPVIALEVF
jgi:hypothetical protein